MIFESPLFVFFTFTILVILLLRTSYLHFFHKPKNQDNFLSPLFFNIKEKIWMTALLGGFFVVFFLLITFFLQSFFNKELLLHTLAIGIKQPGYFFSWGFCIFGFNAILICLIRSVIKFLYNIRYR